MSELAQLRKERAGLTARMTDRAAKIQATDQAADLGNEEAEVSLIGLEKQQERDQVALERLNRQIEPLEAEESREARISRLLELAKAADLALTKFDDLQVKAHNQLEATLRQLYLARREMLTQREEFLSLASTLAGVYEVLPDKRVEAEALRETLKERGASLRAIGLQRAQGQPPSVFENAAPYQPPALERWGWLLHQGLDGYARSEAMRQQAAQREVSHAS